MSDVTAITGSGPSEPEKVIDGDLRAGDVVGDFVVESRLGRGAFGTVYKATNPVIGKPAAIKVLARKYSVDPEIVERFISEARAVNQIRHKNIIDIFSFGELPDGRHYYVMEYVDGETLDELLARGPLTLAEAIPILRAVARALDAAHANGIAHRDLKPENVFLGVDDDGGVFPKLLDFGVAKLLGPDDGLKHKTRTGAPIGTPYYMSPEQCRGRDVDHRTDYYAFGVMTYQLLTGEYPIDGEDYMTILMQQISQTPRPPSAIVPELTEGVDAAVMWLMEKDPAARPPNLATAVRTLTDASARAGVFVPRSLTPTASSLPDLPAPSRRWIPLVGAGVLALAIVLVIALRPSDAPKPDPAPPPPPPIAKIETPAIVVETDVIITITDAPPDTEVRAGTELVGHAPGEIKLPRGTTPLTLTLSAPNHAPISYSITPDAPQSISIPLRPIEKAKPTAPIAKPKRNPRDELPDPFRRSH